MPGSKDFSPGQPPGSAMRRIVVSLLKGGVAKSETAVHLAHGLALKGFRVLLVDTDVQAQCSDMLGCYPEKGLAEVIAGWSDPLGALAETRENLWLLAGGTDLAGVKMEIARRELAPEAVLAETLAKYDGSFHVMILDTAPGWDTLLVNALYCCQDVLSPVSMEPMALKGLSRFEERLGVIQKYNPGLSLRWVVPTFVDGRVKKSGEILEQLRERYGDKLAPQIKYSVKLSEATAFGKTIFEHEPKGAGAKSYQKLVDRVAVDCLAGVEPQATVQPPPAPRKKSGRAALASPAPAAPEPVAAEPPAAAADAAAAPLPAPATEEKPALAVAPLPAPATEEKPALAAAPWAPEPREEPAEPPAESSPREAAALDRPPAAVAAAPEGPSASVTPEPTEPTVEVAAAADASPLSPTFPAARGTSPGAPLLAVVPLPEKARPAPESKLVRHSLKERLNAPPEERQPAPLPPAAAAAPPPPPARGSLRERLLNLPGEGGSAPAAGGAAPLTRNVLRERLRAAAAVSPAHLEATIREVRERLVKHGKA
ncbi:MAG: ParA family protein [Deltaproteobacteria bacterium]|nr:ParA family protein [Deltaproteobacteria bacterium]